MSTMFSSRSRMDAQKYAEQEQSGAQAAQRAKVDLAKAADDRRLARYWAQPLAELRQNLSQPALDKYHGMSQVSDRQAPTDGESCNEALLALVEKLKAEGITLNEEGVLRLTCYGVVHSSVFADMERISNWERAFNRLRELKAFHGTEISMIELPAVESKPVVNDIEQLNLSSRAGEKAAKRIVETQFWKTASPLFHEWITSLYTHWEFVPTEAQKEQAFNLIAALNLSPLDRRTYDILRKAAYERGIFPELLTNDEILQRELEMFKRNNPEASERDERVWFARRQKELLVR